MKYQYDRPALKFEFFTSEFDEVQPFFLERYSKNTAKSGQIAMNTKWRAKEKQERKQNALKQALQEQAEKQAKELAVPLEELMKWKKAILQLLLVQVSKYVKESKSEKNIDVWNAEKILRMFKTELWEPNNIWANYNLNTNKVEWLSEEESQALDEIFNSKSQEKKKSSKQ